MTGDIVFGEASSLRWALSRLVNTGSNLWHPEFARFHFQYLHTFQDDGVAWVVHVMVMRYVQDGGTQCAVFHEMGSQRVFSLPNVVTITHLNT